LLVERASRWRAGEQDAWKGVANVAVRVSGFLATGEFRGGTCLEGMLEGLERGDIYRLIVHQLELNHLKVIGRTTVDWSGEAAVRSSRSEKEGQWGFRGAEIKEEGVAK